jgi:hypothetical protein
MTFYLADLFAEKRFLRQSKRMTQPETGDKEKTLDKMTFY